MIMYSIVLKCFAFAVFFAASFAAESMPASATLTESATTRPGLTSEASCHDVRQIFGMKDIGSIQLVPDTQIKGDSNELCPSPLSCCTPKMEERYQDAVKKDLRSMLQTASSYLKTLIATSATTFRESFLTMIKNSENQTLHLFSDAYKKMETATKAPVNQLFSNLASFIQGRDVDLEDQVATFFDSLFPLVYHLSINPKLKDFSEDYKECLRETREEILPFGDIPQKLTTNFARSFGSARTFLQALSLGVEVINTTEHMDFGTDCGKALVKLSYCPHCLGTVSAKPCGAYCLNVVRGCLSQVAELDKPWTDFVSALERMSAGFIGTYNAEEVLSVVDTRISEAIMHAMEIGPELTKKVKLACGNPKRATRDVTAVQEVTPLTGENPSDSNGTTTTTTTTTSTSKSVQEDQTKLPKLPKSGVSTRSAGSGSLLQKIQSIAKKLSESRAFYGNLADTLCNEDSFTESGGEQCWNGHSFGEYSKTIAGIGITAQKYNPELKPSKTVTISSVATLVDKLGHLKQILNSRASSIPQSDSYVVEGSGSGSYWNNRVGDDEDYDSGSGSGDDSDTKPKSDGDLHFDDKENNKRKTDPNKKVIGSSGYVAKSNVITFAAALTVALLWCRQWNPIRQ